MRACLLADADLRSAILRRFRRLELEADFLPAQGVIVDGTDDANVLVIAADSNRVLVSHDFKTMPGHFYRFIQERVSPGVILIPQAMPTRNAVEELRTIWVCQDAEEFRNRIVYLPM